MPEIDSVSAGLLVFVLFSVAMLFSGCVSARKYDRLSDACSKLSRNCTELIEINEDLEKQVSHCEAGIGGHEL